MKKCRILAEIWLLFLLLVTAVPVRAEEPDPGELYALSAVLMDGSLGRVLFEKNGKEPRAMASTTKIMTCILVLEETNGTEEVEVSAYAASQPKVHLGMFEGERFQVKDLLYSLMLESHNDTAVALAEHTAGSVEAFARRMNEKAEELGCTDTHFVTPNGLDAEDEGGAHTTTAEDLARIMRYCIVESSKKEEFLKITQTRSYSFTDLSGTRSYTCQNHNQFLDMMEGALSGKTGFTGNAGYCYVGALERDGRLFIVALLGCGWPNNRQYKWSDTRKLMQYALETYTYQKLPLPETEIQIPVFHAVPENGSLKTRVLADTKTEEREPFQVLTGPKDQITVRRILVKNLEAPAQAGQQAGRMEYYLNEELIKSCAVKLTETVRRADYRWSFFQILHRFGLSP